MNLFIFRRRHVSTMWVLILSNAFTALVVWLNCRSSLPETLVRHRTDRMHVLMQKKLDCEDELVQKERRNETLKQSQNKVNDTQVLYVITPTYTRLTQKSDLTSLCHTLMLVPNLTWIIVEDGKQQTELVRNFLQRCKVNSVHLVAQTPAIFQRYPGLNFSRGVRQRNAGLQWVRDHCGKDDCNGVVYFADDDNKYDLRLFEELRKTVRVSVLPVGFSGGLKFEGPRCKGGVAVDWHAAWATDRNFTLDMAGFAVNVKLLLERPKVLFGHTTRQLYPGSKEITGVMAPRGYLESVFMLNIGAQRKSVECRGVPNEVLVWHVKRGKPELPLEEGHPSDPNVEV